MASALDHPLSSECTEEYMPIPFDPYHRWLGIPPKDQPPNHYRILGLEPFESDLDVIAAAADRQMAYVRLCAAGEQLDNSQKILGELANARLALLNADQKRQYDLALRTQLPTFNQAQAERGTGRFPPRGRLPRSAALAAALLVIVAITWAATRRSPTSNAPIVADNSRTAASAPGEVGLQQSRDRDAVAVSANPVSDSVSDLSPLKGMSLEYINLTNTAVTDISPLHGMPIRDLRLQRTNVSDLSPVIGMALTTLFCDQTRITDLSPLKEMPLKALARVRAPGLSVPPEASYFLGRETLLATDKPGMVLWRERLFARMSRNAQPATHFYRIPPEQVMEVGVQVEL